MDALRSLSLPVMEDSRPSNSSSLYGPCVSSEGPSKAPSREHRLWLRRVELKCGHGRYWDSGEFELLKAGRCPEDILLPLSAHRKEDITQRPKRVCFPAPSAASSPSRYSHGGSASSSCSSGSVSMLSHV